MKRIRTFSRWIKEIKKIDLPSSWCQWPLRKGTVGIELHRSLCCQKPPLHHHLEMGTRKTVLDQTDANTVWTFQTFQKLKSLTSPTSISYISTPSPHQSTARVYDVSVRTSGARNSGVPQNVLVRSPKPIPEKDGNVWQMFLTSYQVRSMWPSTSTERLGWKRNHERGVKVSTFFTQSKVSDLHVTLCVKQQVVQFKISGEETQKIYTIYSFLKQSLDTVFWILTGTQSCCHVKTGVLKLHKQNRTWNIHKHKLNLHSQ